jgi:hypothetical protein
MDMISRHEVLENRKKVVAFLKNKSRKKAVNQLDKGNGQRCCLGHMCYALDIPKERDDDGGWFYDDISDFAPASMMRKVGLYFSDGTNYLGTTIFEITDENSLYHGKYRSLTTLNDDSDLSTQAIGRFLESVIEGGEATPWKPLSMYEEIQAYDD